MLQMYNYIANKDKNIGFKKELYCLSGEHRGQVEGGNRDIWILLEDMGCRSVCAKTDRNTIFFLLKNLSSEFSDKDNWYINFAIEADQESYDLWKNIFAAFIVNHKREVAFFAEKLTVDNGEKPSYQFDYLSYVAHLLELPDVKNSIEEFNKTVPGSETPAWKKTRNLLQKIQSGSFEWRMGLILLVPEITKEFFYDHCEVSFPSCPVILIEKKDWIALLNHELPISASILSDDDNKKEESGLCRVLGIVTLFIVVIGVVAGVCYRINSHNRQKQKGVWKK